jgi:hypothetical protein
MASAADKETPNREFDRQMRRFKRAFEVNASPVPAPGARRTVFRALCLAHFSG